MNIVSEIEIVKTIDKLIEVKIKIFHVEQGHGGFVRTVLYDREDELKKQLKRQFRELKR